VKSTYVCDVYLQIDGGCERTRESRDSGGGVCVRERGARINAMHVFVNHYPTNVRHKPFPDKRRKNR